MKGIPNNEYYEEIHVDDNSITNDFYILYKRDFFNSKEISKISEFGMIVAKNDHFIRCILTGKTYCINIYKKEDEWFYVDIFGYGSFKCDQFDGLIELIKYLQEKELEW